MGETFDHATRAEARHRVPIGAIPIRATPQFLSTFWHGADAQVRGEPRRSPYPDIRNAQGVTWSVAYNRYWLQGYDAASEGGTDG